jgi:ubiquinone/menaquinone biosynthesis C-methylase UbiE
MKVNKHRRRKRELEIELILQTVLDYLQKRQYGENTIQSLEFGCGDGFQIPYLQQISKVTAIDVYTSEEIERKPLDNFFECSISETPFQDEQFDLIFSSHVIEHIEDLDASFREMRRIGRQDCLYAFSVPTNIWMLLSVPAQYYSRFLGLCNRLSGKSIRDNELQHVANTQESYIRRGFVSRLWRKIIPVGHGINEDFLKCLFSFRIKAWERLFQDNGFKTLLIKPLLLYGDSVFPIIPTTSIFTDKGICSSVLFLLGKK